MPSLLRAAAAAVLAGALGACGERLGHAAGAGALEDPEEGSADGPLRIRAFWVRHGESCANVLEKQMQEGGTNGAKLVGLTKNLYRDPSLTNCGIARAKVLGPKILAKVLEEFPEWKGRLLLFSSRMVRAMETALHSFEGLQLYPLANIAEHGITKDNKPMAFAKQRELKLPRGPNTEELLERITFSEDTNPVLDVGGSSYQEFLKNFPLVIMRLFAKGLLQRQDIGPGSTLPVIIVSHSNFMKKELQCMEGKPQDQQRKPFNNEAWVQDYLVPKWTEPLEPAGCSESLLQPGTFPDAPELVCKSSVARCGRTPASLILRDAGKCAAFENDMCGGTIVPGMTSRSIHATMEEVLFISVPVEDLERKPGDGQEKGIRCCCDADSFNAWGDTIRGLYSKGRSGQCGVFLSRRKSCPDIGKEAKPDWAGWVDGAGGRALRHYKTAGGVCNVSVAEYLKVNQWKAEIEDRGLVEEEE